LADPQDGWLKREFEDGLIWRSMLVQAQSFKQNKRRILSPATAEERWDWWQKRNLNGLWAERYGGNFGLVEELMDSSRRNARWTRQLYALEAFVLAGLLGWFFQSSIIDMLNWAVFIQPYKSVHVRPYVLGRDAERALKPGDSFQECK